jgi:hypothetical protein
VKHFISNKEVLGSENTFGQYFSSLSFLVLHFHTSSSSVRT